VLFVRKLATPVTEELLEKTFSQFGKLERVKKLKDYAFVHFEERDAAVKVGGLRCVWTRGCNVNAPLACFIYSFLWLAFPLGDGGDEWEGAGRRGYRDRPGQAPGQEEEGEAGGAPDHQEHRVTPAVCAVNQFWLFYLLYHLSIILLVFYNLYVDCSLKGMFISK